MKYIILLFAFFTMSAAAQTLKPFEHLDREYKRTTENTAVYFTLLEQDARIARNNKTTFYKDGKKRRYEEFANYAKGILHGASEEWYQSGKLLSKRTFVDGLEQGNSLRYWENGQVKRDETFVDGKVVTAKYFDIKGKEVPAYPFLVKPQFPGGMEKFFKYIIKNISTRNMSQYSTGAITASFTVETDGSVTNIMIIRGIDELIDASLVDVLKKSPKWKPALEENEPIPMTLTLPVNLIDSGVNADYFKDYQK